MKIISFLLVITFGLYANCESGHWIQEVSGNGSVVILEDGSVWKISSIDTITSTLWLPTTEITSCDDKLINMDDNEIVEAIKLRSS